VVNEGKRSHEVRDRILSGVVLVGVMLAVVFGNEWVIFGATLILEIVGLSELYGVLRHKDFRLFYPAGLAVALAFPLDVKFGTHLAPVVLFAWLVALLVVPRITRIGERDLAVGLAAALYLGVFGSFGLKIWSLPNGPYWLLLVLSGTASSDIGAWAIGSRFGKHRLAPRISPRKTWEGLAGGMGACFLVVMLLGAILRLPELTWPWAVVLAFTLPVCDILGDLTASMVKRYAGVKNYGNLIPGHGGILDRFDGIVLALPVSYAVIQLILTLP
jgi:phosphatidate cytidylyltransferase